MRSNLRLPFRLPSLALVTLLAAAFMVGGCGTSSSTGGTGGTPPTATTAPTAAPTNTVPAPTTTPSGTNGKATVSISGAYGTFGFNPGTVTIKTGTTVTWTNNTAVPHTVTSDAGDPAAFNGSLMHNGATFSFTFATAGTYSYHCSVHPYMTATITVTA